MRRGFSFILAIIFVITISSLGTLALTLSSTSAKQTGDIFAKEQGELMLEGFIEYVMLLILKHDFNIASNNTNNDHCLRTVEGQTQGGGYSGIFKMKAEIQYFGTIGNCVGVAVSTPETQGTVVIDVYATHTTDNTGSKNSTIYPVKIHKKIVQKL